MRKARRGRSLRAVVVGFAGADKILLAFPLVIRCNQGGGGKAPRSPLALGLRCALVGASAGPFRLRIFPKRVDILAIVCYYNISKGDRGRLRKEGSP